MNVERFFVHHNLSKGEPLAWCPLFVYCEKHHNRRNEITAYVLNHCERQNCEVITTVPPDTCLHCDYEKEKAE